MNSPFEQFYYDTREPKNIQHIAQIFFPNARPKALKIGDYLYQNRDIKGRLIEVCFERKSSDFSNLAHTYSQLERLAERYSPHAYLILSTNLGLLIKHTESMHKKLGEAHVLGAVGSLCVRGITPIFCDTPRRMFQIMKVICRKAVDKKERWRLERHFMSGD